MILTRIRKSLPMSKDGKFGYIDLRLTIQKLPDIVNIFEECYRSVMRKPPTTEQIGLFVDHYVYQDDYKRAYASNIVRHTVINGAPLMNDTAYQKSHVTIL
jgi:hypothetical protein